jgi:hypothetical protein
MNFDLTEKEYRIVLAMTRIAGWVLGGAPVRSSEEATAYRAFQQKILAAAKEAGCGNLVSCSHENFYTTTEAFELDPVYRRLRAGLPDAFFWEQLTERMALAEMWTGGSNAEEFSVNPEPAQYWERLAAWRGYFVTEFMYRALGGVVIGDGNETPWGRRGR